MSTLNTELANEPLCACGCGCEPDGDWHWSQRPWCPCISNDCSCVTDTQRPARDS